MLTYQLKGNVELAKAIEVEDIACFDLPSTNEQ